MVARLLLMHGLVEELHVCTTDRSAVVPAALVVAVVQALVSPTLRRLSLFRLSTDLDAGLDACN